MSYEELPGYSDRGQGPSLGFSASQLPSWGIKVENTQAQSFRGEGLVTVREGGRSRRHWWGDPASGAEGLEDFHLDLLLSPRGHSGRTEDSEDVCPSLL